MLLSCLRCFSDAPLCTPARNRDLFPNPKAYVSAVQTGHWAAIALPGVPTVDRPLKLLLNTHSFEGADPCCVEYAQLAALAGWSNRSEPVPFVTTDLRAMEAFYSLLLSRNASGEQTRGTRPSYWWTDGAASRWHINTTITPKNPRGYDTGAAQTTAETQGLHSIANLFVDVHLHDSAIRFGADKRNRPMVMPR